MKRASVFLIVLLLSAVLLTLAKAEENPGPWWVKDYYPISDNTFYLDTYALTMTSNGDFIIAGYIQQDGRDLALLRIDRTGNLKWAKIYGGSGDDVAFAVAIAGNGDIIVAGFTDSFGAGDKDVWVLRLDEDGNVKWQKTYGGGKPKDSGAFTL